MIQTDKNIILELFKISALALIMTSTFLEKGLAQGYKLSDITTKFEHFRDNNLQEKLFVHTNKNFYLAGEIMWFKVYDINEATNAPFDFSKVVYIELLDQNNIPVLQTKVALEENGNGGSIVLPFTLHSGNYLFRAYTSWMKNFSLDYYFQKTITIINTTQGNDFPQINDSTHYEVKFFPEGGDLVNGLRSEVGFHVVDQYANGTNFSGVILDGHNDTILHFQPYKFGIGHFYFTPDKNEHYKVIVRINNGPTFYPSLPEIDKDGLVMHLQDITNNQLQVTVSRNKDDEKFCYLIIHNRGSVKIAEVLFFNNGQANFTIDKNKLGDGISQFTVFNSERQPVCERLYFKKPFKELIIHSETNQQTYSLRDRLNLNFHTNDENHNTVRADMSVSVYRLDSLQTEDQSNILNYIWLRSELRGYIESPGYYFESNNDSVTQAADNLMLTQGWRRFKWSDVMQNKLPAFQYVPELSGHLISGKVVNSLSGLPEPEIVTYLAVMGRSAKVQAYLSDTAGRFYFNTKNLYGIHQIVVETDTQTKDSTDRIEILNPYSNRYSQYPLSRFGVTSSLDKQLYDHNIWTQAQHAYHAGVFNHFLTVPADTSSFFGKASKTYWLDNYIRYTTMEEVLKEYVQEVAVRKRDNRYHFMVVNNYDKSLGASLFPDDPLVIVDGIPVFDINKVIAFSPLKVQKLEVVTGRHFYRPIIADGILSYTTYKGDMDNFPLNPHVVRMDYDGLQKELEFYSPEYSTVKEKSSHIPDFRNALYWAPDIRTDQQGNASRSFYTSDIPGQYIVIVNGISKDGHAGHTSFTFDVKK